MQWLSFAAIPCSIGAAQWVFGDPAFGAACLSALVQCWRPEFHGATQTAASRRLFPSHSLEGGHRVCTANNPAIARCGSRQQASSSRPRGFMDRGGCLTVPIRTVRRGSPNRSTRKLFASRQLHPCTIHRRRPRGPSTTLTAWRGIAGISFGGCALSKPLKYATPILPWGQVVDSFCRRSCRRVCIPTGIPHLSVHSVLLASGAVPSSRATRICVARLLPEALRCGSPCIHTGRSPRDQGYGRHDLAF